MGPTAKLSALPIESTGKFIKKAAATASSYGFFGIDSLNYDQRAKELFRGIKEWRDYRRPGAPLSEEMLRGLACFVCLGKGDLVSPIQFYHASLSRGELRRAKPGRLIHFSLEVVGSAKSVAEAMILKAALAILEEIGMDSFTLHINSLGDRDSATRFSRELSGFLRRQIDAMSPIARELIKTDLFAGYDHLTRHEAELVKGAPRPIDFLTETSRRHFFEILEYLESMETPFEIDHSLVGEREYSTGTVFEFRTSPNEEELVVARGGRYDEIGRRLLRTAIPAVGLTFASEIKAKEKFTDVESRIRKPKVFFIQLGPEAKLKSLLVVDAVRKAKLPILQSLGKDRLAAQLSIAEKIGVPYTIIMGHKEALESSVIVRHMETRSQNTVPLLKLTEYLKNRL